MSEWDYLPTPYEKIVEDQRMNSLLIVMSLGCMIRGEVIRPIEMFTLCDTNAEYREVLNSEIAKTSFIGVLRTMLQYQDLRGDKKREKVIEIISRHVRRNRTKDL